MRIDRYICDCCRKDIKKRIKLELPIMNTLVSGQKAIMPKKMDICEDCANRFMDLYYEISRGNNSTGMIGIDVSDEMP